MSSKQPRPDARPRKDEALAHWKKAAQQNPALGSATVPTGMPRLDGSLSVETTSPALPSGPDRRNIVLPDPVAFRYLAEDPSVQVVESRGELCGYELYLVEQWACSRQSPALVIATYTGDPKHTVVVGVLAVPADRNDWSPQLKLYFNAMQQYHARPKETDLGELMVTNLSNFPSALTVISIPDGDMKKHRRAFIVNEDLKRMGCSGRSGMTLTDPTPATQAKFYATYKIHEKVPFFEAVLDLVKLCQVALFIFGMLDYGYIDGLLCDATETAIGNWWTEVGSEYYNIEPTDGILGPSTVAALLGTLMGARNRLSSYGAPVTKDVFDIDHTKRAIGHFQKSQKLEKTRRLDRQTLLKLHKVTAKAAAGEEWGVQKAINSTVSQFGKRGEILSGVIGTREKAGISEIETVDIDKFKELVHGERCKWLWRGKPRRVPHEHHDRSLPDMTNLFGKEEEKERDPQKSKDKDPTGSNRSVSFPLEDLEPSLKTRETTNTLYPTPTPSSTYAIPDSATDGALHKQMFKSVADRVSDARSGLGRIRDAVGGGLKSHGNRPKDEFSEASSSTPGVGGLVQSASGFSSPVASGKVFTWQNKPQEYLNAFQKKHPDNIQAANEVLQTTSQATPAAVSSQLLETTRKSLEISEELDNVRKEIVGRMSAAPSSVDERDLLGPFLQAERNRDSSYPVLQRRHSVATPSHPLTHTPNENRWPRRLSFSAAAEAVLYWDEIVDLDEEATTLEEQRASAEFMQTLYGQILGVQSSLSPWVAAKIKDVEALEEAYKGQDESLQQAYYAFSDEHHRMKQNSTEIIAEEKGRVTMAIKDVEVQAAKLDYEVNALLSKVQDVEDGIAGFEASVVEVEKQAEELKKQLEMESLLHWLVRTLTGIGTGPNITRED